MFDLSKCSSVNNQTRTWIIRNLNKFRVKKSRLTPKIIITLINVTGLFVRVIEISASRVLRKDPFYALLRGQQWIPPYYTFINEWHKSDFFDILTLYLIFYVLHILQQSCTSILLLPNVFIYSYCNVIVTQI